MSSFFGTLFTNDVFPASGGMHTRSNLTPLRGNWVSLNCDVCDLPISKPAAWAKRVKHHFCGRACCHEFKRVRVETTCVECGCKFEVTPSNIKRKVTCSIECSSVKKSDFLKVFQPEHPTRENGKAKTKVTSEQINQIIAASGSQESIAKQFGISQTLVSFFKTGKHER